MNMEYATDFLAQKLAARQPNPTGAAFVEVGLGSLNYSFEWAAPMGFPCYAVEPLPAPHLKERCRQHRVDLTEAAVADRRGELPLYVGEVEGHSVSDTSSLNPDWWGHGRKQIMVKTLSLHDYLDEKKISRISLLKVDTEGSEFTVLGGLETRDPVLDPEFVIIEYGGGGRKSDGVGGWVPKFWAATENCIALLKQRHYASVIILEEALDEPILISPPDVASVAAALPPDATVGNMIFSRQPLTAADLKSISRGLRSRLLADAARSAASRGINTLRHYGVRAVKGVKRRL